MYRLNFNLWGFFLFAALLLGSTGALEARSPSVLFLTWMHDPTTTMTVQWQTVDKDLGSEIAYREAGESEWETKEGNYARVPKTNLLMHVVELDGLKPGGEYEFRLANKKGTYRFRTLPASLERPVSFVVGGDAYFYLAKLRKMNQQIAARDPDFVVVGGDIAYTNGTRAVLKGKGWEIKRWRTFLKEWKEQMVTSDGRLIPMVPVLGNHDIKAVALSPKEELYLFYELFAMAEKGVPYRTLDAGDYLSLFLLDTGHSYHIEGLQAKWLEKSLAARENISYKMAAYHIGAYPSVYSFHGRTPRKIRSEWSPLFERYHVNAAFEHHNHAYKRTYRMKDGKIDPDGVLYLGDGSWGVSPRKPKRLWYLEAAAQANAVCLVTLGPKECRVEAVNNQGDVIDSVLTFPTQSMVAWNEARLIEY